MIARLFLSTCVAFIALQAPVSPAAAHEDGALAGLHAKVRVGNKLCMADHFHYGASSGQPTRKAAEVAAIRDWAGFTAWEYGNHWGSAALAASKGMSCAQSGSGWSCKLSARPCRRL